MTALILIGSLLLILVAAELFVNALEHIGERLKISEGVTGSIFAAVGTAMPETMVPVVAIFSTAATQEVREEVGVGAILGAPLMLGTIAMFLIALFASFKRGWGGAFHPERTGMLRDLSWFMVAFGLSTVAIFVPHDVPFVRGIIGIALVVLYFLYLMVTIRASSQLVAEGHGTTADDPLYIARVTQLIGWREGLILQLLQLALGFAGIVAGAHGFVHGIESLSAWLGISALVLSLLIIPVATELPEKVNSVLWIRRGKDTLAFGNVTGAMVFQGSLLPALGILLTPWEARAEVVAVLVLTLLAGGWTLLMLRRGTLRPYHLLFNGGCYVAYGVYVTMS